MHIFVSTKIRSGAIKNQGNRSMSIAMCCVPILMRDKISVFFKYEMNIEDLRAYCLSKKAATESFPFDETTLVFKVMNKMFAITDLEDDLAVVIKCHPEEYMNMRERFPAVTQPRYFRGSWNLVKIDGSINVDQIKKWIDESYELIVSSLTKKDQKMLAEM